MPGEPMYETSAELYLHHAADSAYNAWYDRPAVLELLGDVAGARVLDVGCGPGLYAAELIARGADVVGMDASPAMIALATRRVASAEFRVHDLETAIDWLSDETFDAAVMALVIHHLDGRGAVLSEVHRILRPGGRLVVSTNHPAHDWLRLGGSYFDREPVEEVWSTGLAARYWRQPLTDSVREFRNAGFVIQDIVEPRPQPAMADRYPETFEKLSREPAFINFELVKRP